jgi:predicted Zn-dependent protease
VSNFFRISFLYKVFFFFSLIVFNISSFANIIRDAEIEKFLEEMSRPIFGAANLNINSVDIYIFNDRSINAFVACGQKVFVNTGLIQSFEEPSMLRGVMAHETGHIAGGHLARSDEALEKAQAPMLIGLLLGVGAAIAGDSDAAQALLLGSQQIAQGMVAKYSRSQESAADQAAIRYLEKIEKSSNGMLEVLYKFANQEALSSRQKSIRVRSHPISRDRIRSLEQKAKNSQFINEKDNDNFLFQYKMIQAKLDGFLNNPDDIIKKNNKESLSIISNYSLAIAYYRKALLGKSLLILNKMIDDYPGNPWFYELKGQILYESGKIKESIKPYEKALLISPKEPLLMVALATALNAQESRNSSIKALHLLKSSLRYDKKNSNTWFQLAIAFSGIDDLGNAELSTAERHFLTGNVKMASFHAKKSLKYLQESSISKLRAEDILLDSKNKAKWKKRCPV